MLHATYGWQNIIDEEITLDMISYALEHEAEEAVWDIWVSVYPGFTTETFIPFSDFKKQRIKIDTPKVLKSDDEINEEMGKVVAQFEKKERC